MCGEQSWVTFFVWWQHHQVLSLALCHWHRKREIIVSLCCCVVSVCFRREGEGVRVFWDRLREPSFTSRWNPFTTDYPFVTFTHHPVSDVSESVAALCDVRRLNAKSLTLTEGKKIHFSQLSSQWWRFSFIVSNITRILWVIQVEACPQLPSSLKEQQYGENHRVVTWVIPQKGLTGRRHRPSFACDP